MATLLSLVFHVFFRIFDGFAVKNIRFFSIDLLFGIFSSKCASLVLSGRSRFSAQNIFCLHLCGHSDGETKNCMHHIFATFRLPACAHGVVLVAARQVVILPSVVAVADVALSVAAALLFKLGHSRPLFLNFHLVCILNVKLVDLILPMTGFEPQISSVGSDRFAN